MYVYTSDGCEPPHLEPVELTAISLEVTFGEFTPDIRCPLCKAAFDARLAEVLAQWASQPLTI